MNTHTAIDTLFNKLDGALAKNTIRAYRSDFRHFNAWCSPLGINPIDHTPADMMSYVQALVTRCSTATINRRIASLSSIFKFLGLADTTKNTDFYLLMKKIKRQKGTAQLQAEPLTAELIEKLLPYCGTGLAAKRNKVMLYLGHQTMRRRSELCQFQFSDLRVLPANRYGIRLRFSKTDQMGKGKNNAARRLEQ